MKNWIEDNNNKNDFKFKCLVNLGGEIRENVNKQTPLNIRMLISQSINDHRVYTTFPTLRLKKLSKIVVIFFRKSWTFCKYLKSNKTVEDTIDLFKKYASSELGEDNSLSSSSLSSSSVSSSSNSSSSINRIVKVLVLAVLVFAASRYK